MKRIFIFTEVHRNFRKNQINTAMRKNCDRRYESKNKRQHLPADALYQTHLRERGIIFNKPVSEKEKNCTIKNKVRKT